MCRVVVAGSLRHSRRRVPWHFLEHAVVNAQSTFAMAAHCYAARQLSDFHRLLVASNIGYTLRGKATRSSGL
jgi:hypothetical protein